MKKSKLVVGHLMNDELLVKTIPASKHLDWLKWLEPEKDVRYTEDPRNPRNPINP